MTNNEQSEGRRRQGPRGRRPEWLAVDRRGRPVTTAADRGEIRAWFLGNLTDKWFVDEAAITIDDYEILVVGTLESMDLGNEDESSRNIAIASRLDRFREDTRDRRITIATDAQARFDRKVSWGARVNDATKLFTTASVPVMTRLRMEQRQLLDTLVEANVARSRSDALTWCVDLVGQHEDEWIASLRSALDTVNQAREKGPSSSRD